MRFSISFIVADAQTYPFESASFDAIVSRFGVMFFDDSVAAFTNLRRAAKPDAPLRVVVWRSPDENPFMTTAEHTAAPLLPDLPARRQNEPGQFGLADPGHVRRILEESGWSDFTPPDACPRISSGSARTMATTVAEPTGADARSSS